MTFYFLTVKTINCIIYKNFFSFICLYNLKHRSKLQKQQKADICAIYLD
jgi:hypothetical protein